MEDDGWDEDWDDETCDTEGCDNRIDDGEGWNGRCGDCADRLENNDD
jgi:hypothetical protein